MTVVATCSTACTPLAHEDVDTRVRVKCILDRFGYAMYFSRGVLPQNKDGQVRDYPTPFQDRPYLLHLGLACFDRGFLAQYCKMPPTPLMVSFIFTDSVCALNNWLSLAGMFCGSSALPVAPGPGVL